VSPVLSEPSSSPQSLPLLWLDSESSSSDSYQIGHFGVTAFGPPAATLNAGARYFLSMGLLLFTIIGHSNEIAVNVLFISTKLLAPLGTNSHTDLQQQSTCRSQIYYKVLGLINSLILAVELGVCILS